MGNFPCTGMHGGKMFLRTAGKDISFPRQVSVKKAEPSDLEEIAPIIEEYCEAVGLCAKDILQGEFIVVSPDNKNPYKQMYVAN